jgi:Family of unknown function (DUF6090)
MKKILETLNRKWAEYLLEILVIVVGILGAFALNNWNENRKSNQIEAILLTELHKSVKEEIYGLNRAINQNRTYISSAEIVLNTIENKQIFSDSVSDHLQRSFKIWKAHINTSAFGNLKDYGLHFIKNDETRNSILSGYDGRAKFVDLAYQRYDQFLYNVVEPELAERFEFKEIQANRYGLFPLDNDSKSNHHRLKYLLRKSIDLQDEIIRAKERTIATFEIMDEALKIELRDL